MGNCIISRTTQLVHAETTVDLNTLRGSNFGGAGRINKNSTCGTDSLPEGSTAPANFGGYLIAFNNIQLYSAMTTGRLGMRQGYNSSGQAGSKFSDPNPKYLGSNSNISQGGGNDDHRGQFSLDDYNKFKVYSLDLLRSNTESYDSRGNRSSCILIREQGCTLATYGDQKMGSRTITIMHDSSYGYLVAWQCEGIGTTGYTTSTTNLIPYQLRGLF